MGKTAFSGPVYGAKSLLWQVHRDNIAISTAAQTIASMILPVSEDWLVTNIHAYRGSSGSTAFVTQLTDDSTVVGSVAITSSATGVAGSTFVAASAGEYEGAIISAGSSVSVTLQNGNSSAVGSSDVTVWVYGYPRFISSTRLEG